MVTTAVLAPELLAPTALHRGLLVWRWPTPMTLLTSSSVHGGMRECTSLINFGVDLMYGRTDLAAHANEIGAELGLTERSPALLTAANVHEYGTGEFGGVLANATVGVTKPTWAADPGGGWNHYVLGTINIVVQVPVRLSTAALVGAVITVTEAKAQALIEHRVPGTGTASDAVAIVCPGQRDPGGGEEPFAGPRSAWGSQIALAAHAAVTDGLVSGRRSGEGGVTSNDGEGAR